MNIFGVTDPFVGVVVDRMATASTYVQRTAAPTDRPTDTLDASDLPPPQPLKNTLERLADVDDETVLVQFNDRRPQHLYPQLEDRGYRYQTIEDDGTVVTVIWK